MIYAADIITPANTPLESPLCTRLKVTKGLIYRVEIDFPPGPCGFLYVAIFDGSYRCWPSTPGTWLHSDSLVIAFDDTYLKETQPYEFQIYTYSIDDTYEHWCQVRLGMVSKEIFMARFLPSLTYQEMLKAIEGLGKLQEEQKQAVIEQPFSWLTPEGE
jgi:hypothetical protein